MASFTLAGAVQTLHVAEVCVVEAQRKHVKFCLIIFYTDNVIKVCRETTVVIEAFLVESIKLLEGDERVDRIFIGVNRVQQIGRVLDEPHYTPTIFRAIRSSNNISINGGPLYSKILLICKNPYFCRMCYRKVVLGKPPFLLIVLMSEERLIVFENI